jgi:hypothetical protein
MKYTKVIEVYIDLNEALEYVQRRLGDLQKKAPMVIRTAINKTAKEAKKKDERITKKMYTSKSDINSLNFIKATTGNLEAILEDRGENISMTHFNHYVGKRGISAVINTTHGRQTVAKYGNKAFMGDTIFVRRRSTRFPIDKMASISSPVMHGNPQTFGTMEDETLQKLYENIEKELERILGS